MFQTGKTRLVISVVELYVLINNVVSFLDFDQVLFPLLYELLTEIPNANVNNNLLEESRMRAATIMSKVFLHHLTPLITLDTFNELWFDILDYIEKFMRIGSDMLHEAMLESLKNMLLVMHSVRKRFILLHSNCFDINQLSLIYFCIPSKIVK